MKKKKLFLAMASTLTLGGIITSNQAFAAVSDAELQKILIQERQLAKEVQYLNNEVAELKRQKATKRYRTTSSSRTGSNEVVHPASGSSPLTGKSTTSAPVPQTGSNMIWTHTPPPSLTTNKRSGRYPTQLPPTPLHKLQGERVTNGITVTTSPYVGLRSAFDASDLVSNLSTMNEDLRLLQQRQKVNQELVAAGDEPLYQDRPLVILSGSVVAQIASQKPFSGGTSSGIDLTNGEFDVLSYVSSWATGLISMGYDNGPFPNVTNDGFTTTTAQIVGAGDKIANSRFYLKRGFLTIGDLNKFPFYFTAGQMFAPFGTYTSQLLDTTIPQQIGQTNARSALIGLYQDGVYLQGYGFDSYTRTVTRNNTPPTINTGGANAGFQHTFKDDIGFNVGAGYISNIANSLGMQLTNAPTGFQGFGFSSLTEEIQHNVSATDLHGELDIKKLSLIAEYIGANRNFDKLDLDYNDGGARPRGLHLEGDYTFNLYKWPSVFTLAYGHSWQALPLSLPLNSYIVMLTTSFWKDTIEAIEYRHDQNYPTSDFGGGNNTSLSAIDPGFFTLTTPSVGGSQNTVTAQIGVYF